MNNKAVSDEDEAEGLALLIPDIQNTATICTHATAHQYSVNKDQQSTSSSHHNDSMNSHSHEERYISTIKQLQFGEYPAF